MNTSLKTKKMKTKYTKGEWVINKHSATTVEINGSNRSVASTGGYQSNIDSEKVYNENIANAKLIAEAGNVANVTGKTPRQLLKERDTLLAAMVKICNDAQIFSLGESGNTVKVMIDSINEGVKAIKQATE